MIDIDMEYTREPSQIEMPCFGILFETYDDFNIVHYYGNGPEENYIDRKKGAILKQHLSCKRQPYTISVSSGMW